MNDRRRRDIRLGLKLALGAAVVIAASSAAAVGPVLYRVTGNACLPLNNQTAWIAKASTGLEINESTADSTADTVVCPIPTAPGIIELGGAGEAAIAQVTIRFRQGGLAAAIGTTVRAHDYDSNNFCTCGSTTLTVPAATYAAHAMPFDCGSCSPSSTWSLTAEVARSGAGSTLVKQIAVYSP
jgi:hypothetical protein